MNGKPPPAFLEGLDAAGLGLRATLPADRYDSLVPPAWRRAALLPGAHSVILLASGGRSLWDAFRSAPERCRESQPLDAYTERVAGQAAAILSDAGHPSRALCAHQRLGGSYADFVAIGAAAGLGAPSRLGLLLHPRHGPWLSLRALILSPLDWHLAPEAGPGFDPCTGCPAPCQDACPGSAVSPSGFDPGRCASTRRQLAGCAESCAARHACVVGRESAYAPEALAHHMRHGGLP